MQTLVAVAVVVVVVVACWLACLLTCMLAWLCARLAARLLGLSLTHSLSRSPALTRSLVRARLPVLFSRLCFASCSEHLSRHRPGVRLLHIPGFPFVSGATSACNMDGKVWRWGVVGVLGRFFAGS